MNHTDGRDKMIGISQYGIFQKIRVRSKCTSMQNAAYAKYWIDAYETDETDETYEMDEEIPETKDKDETESNGV
jgi:hypothetical protein